MREEAFGVIGILPNDFYMMELDDYLLLHRGFYSKKLEEKRTLRWAVSPLVQMWASKKVDILKIMPLPDDDKLKKDLNESGRKVRDKNWAYQVVSQIDKAKKEGKKSGVSLSDRLEAIRILKDERDQSTDRS